MLANASELVTEMVGTYNSECTSISGKNSEKLSA